MTPDHDLTEVSRIWTSAIADCDVVVFLAFDVGGANYLREFQNTHAFLHSNTLMMLNVFETVKECNKPIIFASSVTAFDPGNSYGSCKLLGERLCASIGSISVQLWNIYGFETDPSRYHVIMDFISQARTEGQISCKTTGQERNNFCTVRIALLQFIRSLIDTMILLSGRCTYRAESGPRFMMSLIWLQMSVTLNRRSFLTG